MKEEEIREQIDIATKLVNTWPSWKQRILVESGEATVPMPRRPVDNSVDSSMSIAALEFDTQFPTRLP